MVSRSALRNGAVAPKTTGMQDLHTRMMQTALQVARTAIPAGEIPIAAVVYKADGTVVSTAHNATIVQANPTAHAEFLACQAATQALQTPYLEDCYVAVTLEPCAMCAQALSYFRVKGIYYGAADAKSGGTDNGARVLHHAHHKPPVIGGLLEAECADLLTGFFAAKRQTGGA